MDGGQEGERDEEGGGREGGRERGADTVIGWGEGKVGGREWMKGRDVERREREGGRDSKRAGRKEKGMEGRKKGVKEMKEWRKSVAKNLPFLIG